MIIHFLHTLQHYVIDVAPSLAVGFLLSGVVHEFVSQSLVNKYLNQKGIKPILYTTLAGIFLPLCCFGSLPVAIGFRKKGVPLCEEGEHGGHSHHRKGIKSRIVSVFSFGFIDMPKERGLELVIGLILAAVVASIAPLGNLVKNYLAASAVILGYIFSLL